MVVLDEKTRVEMLRYIRLFCSRSLQVIIQSRRQDSPEGVFRKSNPDPPAQDWFNLNINTHTVLAKDVHKECKFHLSSGLPYDEPLCCQLSIIQGDIAQVVEIWELRVESQKSMQCKYSEVYERQCLLLKSLISLTRVLPAYSACRDWSENKFDIKYEIFKKDPDMHLLGESRGSLLVGHVVTALGELSVTCTYRRMLGFGRPSNTVQPAMSSRQVSVARPIGKAASRYVQDGVMNRRHRPESVSSMAASEYGASAPPPGGYYSSSPGSYSNSNTSFTRRDISSPRFPITESASRISRTQSNSSLSSCPQSPPGIWDGDASSPARRIKIAPVPKHPDPIDMQIPIRGAFVSAESESVPDSAPNYYDSRHRSTSPLYSSKSQSNPSLGQINMDIDDGPSLDIELSNDEDVFVPAAGAFVSKELRRSETASILYESLRKPKELSHLENREEDIDGIQEICEAIDDYDENEFDDYIAGL